MSQTGNDIQRCNNMVSGDVIGDGRLCLQNRQSVDSVPLIICDHFSPVDTSIKHFSPDGLVHHITSFLKHQTQKRHEIARILLCLCWLDAKKIYALLTKLQFGQDG